MDVPQSLLHVNGYKCCIHIHRAIKNVSAVNGSKRNVWGIVAGVLMVMAIADRHTLQILIPALGQAWEHGNVPGMCGRTEGRMDGSWELTKAAQPPVQGLGWFLMGCAGSALSPESLQAESPALSLTEGRAVTTGLEPKGSRDSFWSSTMTWIVPGKQSLVGLG